MRYEVRYKSWEAWCHCADPEDLHVDSFIDKELAEKKYESLIGTHYYDLELVEILKECKNK